MHRGNRPGKIFVFGLAVLALAAPWSAMAQTDPNAGLDAVVRATFADIPEMVPVAKCESGFRQYASQGVVLRGGPESQYVGIFQIDERLHAAKAAAMGQDIHTVGGNIGYARYLYAVNGIAPWKGCVAAAPAPAPEPGPAPAPAVPPAAPQPEAPASPVPPSVVPAALTLDLSMGSIDAQVRLVQQLLNKIGFAVAVSGPGSPGNETEKFGALTQDAVRRFQCAKKIACDGDPVTGYGRIGPRTRAALNALK